MTLIKRKVENRDISPFQILKYQVSRCLPGFRPKLRYGFSALHLKLIICTCWSFVVKKGFCPYKPAWHCYVISFICILTRKKLSFYVQVTIIFVSHLISQCSKNLEKSGIWNWDWLLQRLNSGGGRNPLAEIPSAIIPSPKSPQPKSPQNSAEIPSKKIFFRHLKSRG